MSIRRRIASIFLAGLVCAGSLGAAGHKPHRSLNGTIWVANRGAHTIQGFDSRTGAVVRTVAMAPNSQPGDLAFAKRKLYVAEEFGSPPAIAIVDPEAGIVLQRILFAAGARPHHVHASADGNLIAVGLFGTDHGRGRGHAQRSAARPVGQQPCNDQWRESTRQSSRTTGIRFTSRATPQTRSSPSIHATDPCSGV